MNAITNIPNPNLQQLANEFINLTFWGPMLREFRANQRPTVYGDGPGSKTFLHQLDQEIIRRISQQGSSPLADALIKQLTAHGSQSQSTPAQPNADPTALRTIATAHSPVDPQQLINRLGPLTGKSHE